MQTPWSDTAYFGTIATMGAGVWVAFLLGLDPFGGSLLGLMTVVGAPVGLVVGLSGDARPPVAAEHISIALPLADDPSPIADLFGFDFDLPF